MEQSKQKTNETTTCDVCSAQYPRGEVRCGECESYRKDVRQDRLITYVSGIPGGLSLGFVPVQVMKIKDTLYWTKAARDTDFQILLLLILVGIAGSVVCSIYWYRVSKKIGRWMWW